MSIIRIPPFQYIHVLDNNSNIKRVIIGPQTFTKQNHEELCQRSPVPMICLAPRQYIKIKDPYVRKPNSHDPISGAFDESKQVQIKIRKGDFELRFAEEWPEPFFLYPGESVVGVKTNLEIIAVNNALRLKAERKFLDTRNGENIERAAGDEWLFKGPATYRPRVEETIVTRVKAQIIKKGNGLKLQAAKAYTDHRGVLREAGETWVIREEGAYLPHVDENVLQSMSPIELKPTKAVHLKALASYTDAYSNERKAGEEWLITFDISETHMLHVAEAKIKDVHVTTLSKNQYCVIMDPMGPDGKTQYGTRKLQVGEQTFFLQPGERLEKGIQTSYVLSADEGLLLKANEEFIDTSSKEPVKRFAGQWWMVKGPTEYVPPVEVSVEERRKAIPLDKNEGIYVREYASGDVRAVKGTTYMLTASEELWEKPLPEETLTLLQSTKFSDDENFGLDQSRRARNKTRVVTYRVPHNSAVQVFDYKSRKARVVRGPELVMLEPDEQFTVVSLSGKTPKRPNEVKTIAIRLGPDFMTDVIEVETMDHARLRLKMAYNWFFDVSDGNDSRIFVVRDFVGDTCKAIAGLVRGAAASTAFDEFHKHSSEIIRTAVFGKDEEGKIKETFVFAANKLCVTNIDIQSVEPVDESTRESLMKSVQLAIEITAQKQERGAKHRAQRTEQQARGQIEKQKIINQKMAESDRKQFIELQGQCKAIEQAGSAKAEAHARALAGEIKGNLEIETAALNAQASTIEADAQLADTRAAQLDEITYKDKLAALEVHKAEKLSEIESSKFSHLVKAIGAETIKSIARAGPETQALLLSGLGLKGYLMTDGNSPINLFNAAKGMVGQ